MKRREFITLLGGAVATWPMPASAQHVARLPTIGFLGPSTASSARGWIAPFSQRLRELGWIEGRTAGIAYRWADGRTELFAPLAAELVSLKVDVIVTWGTATAVAVKQATSTVPTVFAIVGDPVGSGLVTSLSRPGANITGLSTQHPDAGGKRIDLLRELVPGLRHLAILTNADNPGPIQEMREAEQAARGVGINVIKSEIRRSEEIRSAFEVLIGRAQ